MVGEYCRKVADNVRPLPLGVAAFCLGVKGVRVDAKQLDRVVKETVAALEKGKDQIHEIAEAAREEHQAVSRDLEELKQQVLLQMQEVERAAEVAKGLRRALAEYETSFDLYSEEERRAMYDRAHEAQMAFRVAEQKEQHLRQERDRLERRLKSLAAMVERAERLVSHVGVALGYLLDNFKEVGHHLENVNQVRAMGISVIQAQEDERRRVAREIHDGPAQQLAHVVLRIDLLEKLHEAGKAERLRDELAYLKQMVRLSLADVRKIIFDLRPMALDDLGLIPALRAYLKEFAAKWKLEAEFVLLGPERRLPTAIEVALFRLVQEALSNVAKHAQAKQVWVKLELTPDRGVNLLVLDDGVGFDPAAVQVGAGGRHLGLYGMRERVELLGGQFVIDSSPGKGSRLSFQIPLSD